MYQWVLWQFFFFNEENKVEIIEINKCESEHGQSRQGGRK
jgi:hypothetical protein